MIEDNEQDSPQKEEEPNVEVEEVEETTEANSESVIKEEELVALEPMLEPVVEQEMEVEVEAVTPPV